MALDPTRIHVESHVTPIWEREESFQDVMSEHIKRAPWLGLSFFVHVIAAALLWALLPEQSIDQTQVATSIEVPEDDIEVIEPEPEPEPQEVPEDVETDQIEENDLEEIVDNPNNEISEVEADTPESAFDSLQSNTAIGLLGGAAGPGGGRPGRGTGFRKRDPRAGKAIDLALQWLVDHQDEDGKWDADGFMKHDTVGTQCDGSGNAVNDVGVTALALLAFLGDGSTNKSGAYRDQVKKATKWLIKQQDPGTGLFGTNSSHGFIYNHAVAAYAMAEAQGLSRSSILKKYAQRGLNYLESHRNPYAVWRYQPRDNDNDSSVTGWCIMAYKSGESFEPPFQLQVNKKAMEIAVTWMDENTELSTGRLGYTKRGEPSSRHPGDHATRFPVDKCEALTAVGLFARFFCNQQPKNTPVMGTAADTLLQKPPVWQKDGSIDHYYWYYATYALYQMGGKHWDKWQKSLKPAVVKTQRLDDNFKGSWDPVGAWGEDGGRVYSTAILALTLEAYYRYTRIVR